MRRYLTLPLVGAHLVVVACIVVAGLLGTWQLQSWQAERAAQARDLTSEQPVPLDDVLGPDDGFAGDLVGQPVSVSGRWLDDDTVYVAGREVDGRGGYWVLTPFVAGSGSALPVVRGWVAEPGGAPAAPAGDAVEITAWLQPSEGPGAPLEAADAERDDVLGSARTADLAQRVELDLYSGYAIARDAEPGLAAVTPDQLPDPPRLTGLRNLLYALEWWVFGAFAVFIWWRYVRDTTQAQRVASRPQQEAGEQVDEHPVPSSS